MSVTFLSGPYHACYTGSLLYIPCTALLYLEFVVPHVRKVVGGTPDVEPLDYLHFFSQAFAGMQRDLIATLGHIRGAPSSHWHIFAGNWAVISLAATAPFTIYLSA